MQLQYSSILHGNTCNISTHSLVTICLLPPVCILFAGRGLVLQHFRMNQECNVLEELEPIDINLSYDFNYQQTNLLPTPRTVLPVSYFCICMHVYPLWARHETTSGKNYSHAIQLMSRSMQCLLSSVICYSNLSSHCRVTYCFLGVCMALLVPAELE